MSELQPGRNGEPFPAGERIVRLAVPSSDGKVGPNAFELSTADREEEVPSLSVWAERLTTPLQAWELAGSNPNYRLAIRLDVDAVRVLRPIPDSPDVPSLDVQWRPLSVLNERGERVADFRPGAIGHAGIVGLARGGSVTKAHTRSFRLQLADLANAEGNATLLDLP